MVLTAAGLALPRKAGASPTEVVPGLSIEPRPAWAGDSRPPTGPLASEDVLFLLVHHTASANGADPVSVMRSAYDFHTGPQKGWPDVAYNFFIDQDGVVWEGRSGSLDGPIEASATGGSQGFAQLVCLLGDFTRVMPTAAALSSLNRTLAWLADRYRVSTAPGATVAFQSRGSNRWPAGDTIVTSTIAGHRDMSATACPGDTFYPHLIARVPAEVHALRAADGDPEPDEATAPASADPAPTAAQPTTAPSPAATASSATTTSSTPSTASPATASAAPTTAPSAGATTADAASATTSAAPVVTTTSAPSATTSGTGSGASTGGGSDSSSRLMIGVAAAAVALTSGAVWYTTRRSGHAADEPAHDPSRDVTPPDGIARDDTSPDGMS
jgi:hypothetical protein